MADHLTKAQQRALGKMSPGQAYCAHELGESLATLDALVKKGYLEKRAGLGTIFFPRTEIQYVRRRSKAKGI